MFPKAFRFARQQQPEPVAAPAVAQQTREASVQVTAAGQPQEVTYRATVRRTLTQTAVVEFRATEGLAQWEAGQHLAAQIPEDAWTPAVVSIDYDGRPNVYVETMETVAAPVDDEVAVDGEGESSS